MKTLIICIGLAVMSVAGKAQKNNPYDQRGIDFHSALAMIDKDFRNGIIKEFDEKTVMEYSQAVPLENKITMDLVSAIVKTMKDPGFNFMKTLEQSSLSGYARETFVGLCNPKKLSPEEFNTWLTEKTDEISNSKLEDDEKELLLSITAIAYRNPPYYNYNTSSDFSCTITTPEGTNEASCVLVGALVGASFGFYICGVWCALGGAIVGAVLGSLS